MGAGEAGLGKQSLGREKRAFSNIEIVTLAVYLLGGENTPVVTEDVARKANEIAPGRFTWTRYPDQINIDNIRKRLSDGKDPRKGGYLIGSFKEGWRLSDRGVEFSKSKVKDISESHSELPVNNKEVAWKNRERSRIQSSIAIELLNSKGSDAITPQEAEAFFRIDDYLTGEARARKLARIVNAFGNDPELGQSVKILAGKVRRK